MTKDELYDTFIEGICKENWLKPPEGLVARWSLLDLSNAVSVYRYKLAVLRSVIPTSACWSYQKAGVFIDQCAEVGSIYPEGLFNAIRIKAIAEDYEVNEL